MSETTSSAPPSLPAELTEQERQLSADSDWALRDPEVRRRYAGLFVAVHRKTVLGSGKTIGDAVQEALGRPNCPPRQALAKVYVEG